MYGFYYYDYTYILFMIPALIITLYAQIKVQTTFSKYSEIKCRRNLTGAQAAQIVLQRNGVSGVRIERVAGKLTDHFDPSANVIRLSDKVYSSTSVSAVGVACHEAGHAVQHAEDYKPIRIRQMLIPITSISSKLSFPLIFIGLLFPTKWDILVLVGIILFSLAVLFEIATLPVEFDASRRAIRALDEGELLYDEELKGAKKVLKAAAMTYLASAITAIMSLLRLLLIYSGRRGND